MIKALMAEFRPLDIGGSTKLSRDVQTIFLKKSEM